MQFVLSLLLLAVSFNPTRTWYATNEPLNIHVNVGEPAVLVMTDFVGQNLGALVTPEVKGDETIDLKKVFPQASTPGTYVLYAVKPNTDPADGFFGTPLVVDVRGDVRRGASPGPMVWRVEPLRYAKMETDAGALTVAFYYNSAPHTVENFLKLAGEGFYDGLTFHRILPSFIIQGGDPRGDGTGGPGYAIGAEFNERPHVEGVLSMARQRDPLEPIAKPRDEFADSAGSQFMIALAGGKARSLDRRYTAFGVVVDGLEAVRKMAATPLNNEQTGRPKQPPIIQKITLHDVTFVDNPYKKVLRAPDVIPPEDRPTTTPAKP